LVVLLFVTAINVTSNLNAQPTSQDSQNGKFTGTVVNAQTGEAVIGANVAIIGTTKGAATDLDGKFAIRNLSPGTYSVTVSYISYNKKKVTGIEVSAGASTSVNITLQSKTVGMDEIMVTATADQSSSAGLLSIQRKSVPMQDGLSSQQISKLGDGDVGAAIKRVTGVTVQDGKNVFVRGLGNRYSNVQLNGSQLPSTNPNKKEAPIDLFGSGLVSNIVVQKTFTADQSAEFSGGSVQITTREFPEERNLTLSYSSSYNSVSTLETTFTSSGSSTDFLGFDSGKRQLPDVINNQRVTDQNASQVAQGLHNNWGINSNQAAIPSQSVSVNYANQFNEDKMPIGVVSNFSYKYSRELEPDKEQRFIQFFNDDSPNYQTNYNQTEGIVSADLSGMLNIFVKPSSMTKIGLKSLYSNSTSDTKSIIQGPYQNGVNRLTVLNFDRRTVFSNTLEMETYFQNFLSSTLTANVSYNSAMRVRPDRRTTRYSVSGGEYSFAPFGNNNGHFFSDQKDNNYTAKLKYEFKPVDFLNVSAGGNTIIKDRHFTARRIAYQDQIAPFISDEMASQSPGTLFNDELIENGTLEMVETTQFGVTQSDWYDGFQSIYAGFISTQWNAIDRLSFEIGGRIETSVQTIEVPLELGGEYEEVSRVDNTDFLPAVNVTYEVSDRTNLRAAFSRTLARPEFREISNFNFADYYGGQRVYGNPDLKQTSITNYDLRFETYPQGGELFAISAFYKQFENPIELFYRLTENVEVFYDNAPEADLYGIEVEGRKNVTDRLQLVANASYIFSEADMGSQASNRVANVTRSMVGQSPFIVNLSSFYTIPKWDMNLSLSYNTFGERIVTVGQNGQQYDEYEQPFHDLGAQIEYPLGRVDLSLEASNLLNDEREYKQGPATTFRYNPGVSLELGATLSL
jgi:TonB-dependent receptor